MLISHRLKDKGVLQDIYDPRLRIYPHDLLTGNADAGIVSPFLPFISFFNLNLSFMKVELNSKEYSLDSAVTLGAFLESLDIKREGIAVAVNNAIVPRTKWNEHQLNDGDKLIIIKAVCGG